MLDLLCSENNKLVQLLRILVLKQEKNTQVNIPSRPKTRKLQITHCLVVCTAVFSRGPENLRNLQWLLFFRDAGFCNI